MESKRNEVRPLREHELDAASGGRICDQTGTRMEATMRFGSLERFRAKWMPVRVKKTRQNKKIEPRSDSIGTEKALALVIWATAGCHGVYWKVR